MENRILQEAWGEWVGNRDWSHVVTLTTARRFSRERLRKAFVEEWIRYAAKAAQQRVPYFFSIEGGTLGDQAHVHALVAGTAKLERPRLVEAWRHGRAQVDVYDPARAAAYYFAKEIGKAALDYGVSKRLPCLRKSEPQRSTETPIKCGVSQRITINLGIEGPL